MKKAEGKQYGCGAAIKAPNLSKELQGQLDRNRQYVLMSDHLEAVAWITDWINSPPVKASAFAKTEGG